MFDSFVTPASRPRLTRLLRTGLTALALAGLGGLAGCDSEPGPQCSYFSNVCTYDPNVDVSGVPALGFVTPPRLTVQAGTTAVFVASSTLSQPTFQWQRSADGGHVFADIPGAVASALSLGGAQRTDDGTVVRVQIRSGGTSVAPIATLHVSSQPGVVFQDGEFADADWAATAFPSPVSAGPTHGEQQQATGGNPAAFRAMTHAMTPGASMLLVIHASPAADYDPGAQGAVRAIDYAEDCIRQVESAPNVTVDSMPAVEQAGRRYVGPPSTCPSGAWSPMPRYGLGASDFLLVDGPACTTGEWCPDFGASGAPLRFGYARKTTLAASAAAGSVVHGVDNWAVTIWRP